MAPSDIEFNLEPIWLAIAIKGFPSITAFARKVGITPETLRRWKNGDRPRPDNLLKVANALDVDMASLVLAPRSTAIQPDPQTRDRNGRAGAVNSSRSKGGRACRKSA